MVINLSNTYVLPKLKPIISTVMCTHPKDLSSVSLVVSGPLGNPTRPPVVTSSETRWDVEDELVVATAVVTS